MPLPTDLTPMDLAWAGTPFCGTATKNTVDMTTMDYAWAGLPFCGNNTTAAGGGGGGAVATGMWIVL